MLGQLPIGASECSRRRKDMLAVWIEHGHPEEQIRELVKGRLCIGPEKVMASEAPTA